MNSKLWKTKLSFSAPIALAALLNPAPSQAGSFGGWDCYSADQKVYFNFLEPKLGPHSSSHVLQVGGYDGYHVVGSAEAMDFRSYGHVTETEFNVQVFGPWSRYDAGTETLLGSLQGTKDANGQWQVRFSTTDRFNSYAPVVVPLACKF